MLGAIKPIPLVGLTVKNIPSSPPRFEWPIRRRFLVEDYYRRRLTE